jgi:glycosyltransferase involved in cell wall biosynthesis
LDHLENEKEKTMTTTVPLVTVLMPCYNAMPFLKEAMDSIVNQTYRNLEILCINDGSSDETGEILEEYACHDSRIKVIHNEENLKLIKTLNKGVGLAQGEFIARMDADDIAVTDRIERQLQFFQNNPDTDIVSTALIVITESGKEIRRSRHRQHLPLSCLFASFFYMPTGHPDIMGKSSVFKKNLYLFDDHALHTEDYELWSRLLRKGYKIRNMDDYLLMFRRNQNSVSNKYTEIQDTNYIKCVQIHLEEYFNYKVSFSDLQIAANRMPHKVSFENVRSGFRIMNYVRKEFSAKNKEILNREIRKELFVVYYSHLFDVCWQIMKRPGLRNRFYALGKLISHFYVVFNRNVFDYMMRKFL